MRIGCTVSTLQLCGTDISFDELLATPSVKERKEREQQGELLDILMSKTAKERSILEKVRPAPHKDQCQARAR